MSVRTTYITDLKELKAFSFPIDKAISTYYLLDDLPPEKRYGIFDPTYDLEEVHHCYRELFGVIAFVDEEEVLYAIPACKIVRDILKSYHFIEDHYLHVPFIHLNVPVLNAEKWWELLEWKAEMEGFVVYS